MRLEEIAEGLGLLDRLFDYVVRRVRRDRKILQPTQGFDEPAVVRTRLDGRVHGGEPAVVFVFRVHRPVRLLTHTQHAIGR